MLEAFCLHHYEAECDSQTIMITDAYMASLANLMNITRKWFLNNKLFLVIQYFMEVPITQRQSSLIYVQFRNPSVQPIALGSLVQHCKVQAWAACTIYCLAQKKYELWCEFESWVRFNQDHYHQGVGPCRKGLTLAIHSSQWVVAFKKGSCFIVVLYSVNKIWIISGFVHL